MASSSSSSTTVEVRKHDVFLSFCGEDTRYTFTGTLKGVLKQGSINVFIDDDLKRGEEISPSLMNAIEESAISVITFSKGYASSRWCLDELVKIMECKETHKQVVIPVFYHIDPTDVRNRQTGTFRDGFDKLVESFDEEKLEKLQMTEEQFNDKVEKWKKALTSAANLSGRTSKAEPFDYLLAMTVLEDILNILNFMSPSNSDKKLVGVERIIREIESLLKIGQGNVLSVGIWGMPGIGKTTIAKSVFNKFRIKFEGAYFVENIREKSKSPDGLVQVREKLFSEILKHPIKFTKGTIKFTKGTLGHKRVLIVFDDVTTIDQVESLIDDIGWLGSGSRIIVTATDRQVLRNCRVDNINIYEMKGLVENDALQLFSWHAFGQNRPNIDYYDLSKRVVEYTNGVPLAIKVLARCFLGRSKEFWETALKTYERILPENIHNVLKISYDGLNDVEQCIFLDIACFLKGETKDLLVNSSDADDGEVEIALIDLIDKCLITISEDNKIMVHYLLQKMGWEIVRQESLRDPGKRSRLWYHEDIYKVLEENEISNAIEGICLDMSKREETIYLQPNALAKMDRLRIFKLHNAQSEVNNINKVHISDELRYGSTKLRYLCWHGCPLKSLPTKLWKNLVALDMPRSNIEQLWSSAQLHKLKHIDLSFSKYLRIQDLSLAPNLENLILESCTSLCEITSSVDGLNYKLLILNLRHCQSLGSLPTDIRLESLEKVIFSGCSNLKKFPQISRNMKELYMDGTAIEELPSSIENLSRLVKLNLKDCSMLERVPSNICKLTSLEHLNVSGCSKLEGLLDNFGNLTALRVLKAEGVATREVPTSILYLHRLEELDLTNCCIKELPNNLGQLSSLKRLLLGRNFFESIPTSIVELYKLSYIDLSYCERLQVLPELPCNLRDIDAHNCTSLGVSSSLSIFFKNFFSESSRINLSNCFSLNQDAISDFFNNKSPEEIYGIRGNSNSGCVCFPGSEIPELFVSQSIGSSITLGKQEIRGITNLPSLLVCVVVEFQNYHNEGQGLVVVFKCLLKRKDEDEHEHIDEFKGTLRGWNYGNGPDYVGSDHVFLGYDSDFNFSGSYNINDPKYCDMTIQFYVEDFTKRSGCWNVKKCGVLCRNRPPPDLAYGVFDRHRFMEYQTRTTFPFWWH